MTIHHYTKKLTLLSKNMFYTALLSNFKRNHLKKSWKLTFVSVTRMSKKVVEAETRKETIDRELELVRKEYTVIKERQEQMVESKAKLVQGRTAEALAKLVQILRYGISAILICANNEIELVFNVFTFTLNLVVILLKVSSTFGDVIYKLFYI